MPFRKNHSNYRPAVFRVPVETKVSIDGSSVRLVPVDSMARLPDVEDFSPEVQMRAGVPMKDVSTIFKRPSGSDYANFVGDLEKDFAAAAVAAPAPAVDNSNNSNKE